MTGWNIQHVRHIPEDELHAYLDQALSRSQAVEIERHLARCPSCQSHRDGIAGLRDRTTDLLARLGSLPVVATPPFEELRARHLAQRARRTRWLRAGAAAAGLAGLALIGRLTVFSGNPRVEAALSAPPVVAAQPAPDTTVRSPAVAVRSTPAFRSAPPASSLSAEGRLVRTERGEEPAPFAFAKAVETDPGTLPAEAPAVESPQPVSAPAPLQDSDMTTLPVTLDPGLAGLWRTVALDHNNPPAAEMPIVPGLTVVRMRMQPGDDGAQVVAVDQLLESGEVVRTLSGPATRVGTLLAQEAQAEAASGRVTFTIRQADRMVAVTGPADAMSSLLSRVNGRRRY